MNNTHVITKPKTKSVDVFELNGQTVKRVVMEINGRDVQVLSYDLSPMLTVLIGDKAEQVHIIDLDEYITEQVQP